MAPAPGLGAALLPCSAAGDEQSSERVSSTGLGVSWTWPASVLVVVVLARQATSQVSPPRPEQQWVSDGLGVRRIEIAPPEVRWSMLVCGSSVPFLPSDLGCVCERLDCLPNRNCLRPLLNALDY